MRKMSDTERPSEAQLPNEPDEERYSVFSSLEKWCITALVAYAAWFSTLSSFIYFPGLHQLAEYFSVSSGKINLTITSYMAVATVAPMLIGDTADVLSRRPIYVLALGLYVVANVAIASSKTFLHYLGCEFYKLWRYPAHSPLRTVSSLTSPLQRNGAHMLVRYPLPSLSPSVLVRFWEVQLRFPQAEHGSSGFWP